MKAYGKQNFSCHLVSCSAYSSIVKMGAICSSAKSVDIQRSTRRYILHNHRCEDLNSYKMFGFFYKVAYSNYMQIRELTQAH
jgi:hypothetical protein